MYFVICTLDNVDEMFRVWMQTNFLLYQFFLFFTNNNLTVVSIRFAIVGYYCPEGTGKDLKSCPRGTYGPHEGYYDVSQCKPCNAGMYCGSPNMINVTTKCSPGHWCAFGVDRPKPYGKNYTNVLCNSTCPHYDDSETGFGGVCPVGHYCPEGIKSIKGLIRLSYNDVFFSEQTISVI